VSACSICLRYIACACVYVCVSVAYAFFLILHVLDELGCVVGAHVLEMLPFFSLRRLGSHLCWKYRLSFPPYPKALVCNGNVVLFLALQALFFAGNVFVCFSRAFNGLCWQRRHRMPSSRGPLSSWDARVRLLVCLCLSVRVYVGVMCVCLCLGVCVCVGVCMFAFGCACVFAFFPRAI
jgi:hypothetical protein